MSRPPLPCIVSLVAAVLLGCSAGDRGALIVGEEGAGGRSGAPSGSGGQIFTGDAGTSRTLATHIEHDDVVVTFVTLSCSNSCADVVAVATGGYAPYTFTWEDGSTAPARRVCPTSDTEHRVSVTDTGGKSGEFMRGPQTARANLTAYVLACPPDSGTPDAGTADSAPPLLDAGSGGFCIANPSLEGTPGLPELGTFHLPDWTICSVTPDVNPLFASLGPSHGSTYLGTIATSSLIAESAGTSFCSPLEPGRPISFSVDIAVSSYASAPAQLQLWGGATSCSKDELLWTSPTITDVDTWHTFCGTVTASRAFPYLVLWPAPTTFAGAYVLTDNFRAAASCE